MKIKYVLTPIIILTLLVSLVSAACPAASTCTKNANCDTGACTKTTCVGAACADCKTCKNGCDFTVSGTKTTAVFKSKITGCSGCSVKWTFGDGKSSTDLNPTHTYAKSGHYTVHLYITKVVKNADGTSKTVNVCSCKHGITVK